MYMSSTSVIVNVTADFIRLSAKPPVLETCWTYYVVSSAQQSSTLPEMGAICRSRERLDERAGPDDEAGRAAPVAEVED
jgi:hypothetical protein